MHEVYLLAILDNIVSSFEGLILQKQQLTPEWQMGNQYKDQIFLLAK